MRETLRDYHIERVVSTNTSKLYFARRRGRAYVLKEYLAYRFLSPETRKDAGEQLLETEKRAQDFFRHLIKIARLMQKRCRRNGLLNIPCDVFREREFIYKVTRGVESSAIDPARLHTSLTRRQMDVFLKTALTQLASLQTMRFVHGDIKPENLIIVQKKALYSAVMIDYDFGFVVGDSPRDYTLTYTPEYASPEMVAFQTARADGQTQSADLLKAFRKITCATDVFSMGCALAYFLTGHPPGVYTDEAALIPAAMLEMEIPLRLAEFHPVWRTLVREMLRNAPEERPSASEILDALNRAERAGLMDAMDAPFDAASGYDFGSSPATFLGGQKMRVGRNLSKFGTCAVWLLDDLWTVDGHTPLLTRLNQAAVRRKAYYQAVLRILDTFRDASPALPRAQLAQCGDLHFIEQLSPDGPWVTLEQFRENGCSRAEADRLTLELLDAVELLHSQGLLNCALTKEDIWFVTGEDGIAHPFLARPQRFLLAGRIPERDDIDIAADILAPEMCRYLGSQSPGDSLEIANLIGPWSDVFSLGLIYHALLCGRWPATAIPEYAYLGISAQGGDADEPGILFDANIDPARKAVIVAMTAFQPSDRPENCAAVKSMIRSVREDARPPKQENDPDGRKAGREDVEEPIDLSDDSLFVDMETGDNEALELEFEDTPETEEPVALWDD